MGYLEIPQERLLANSQCTFSVQAERAVIKEKNNKCYAQESIKVACQDKTFSNL